MTRLSGNFAGWLTAVATELMDAGKPASIDALLDQISTQSPTFVNDGAVTASLNGMLRSDVRGGQRLFVEGAVQALQNAHCVDSGLNWVQPLDGVWRVPFGKTAITVYGRPQRQAASDRHTLEIFLAGNSSVSLSVGKTQVSYGVHTLATYTEPMSRSEEDALRLDIATYGVRLPIWVWPDATDLSQRKEPRKKIIDGRYRAFFAAQADRPVSINILKAETEEEALAWLNSINQMRRSGPSNPSLTTNALPPATKPAPTPPTKPVPIPAAPVLPAPAAPDLPPKVQLSNGKPKPRSSPWSFPPADGNLERQERAWEMYLRPGTTFKQIVHQFPKEDGTIPHKDQAIKWMDPVYRIVRNYGGDKTKKGQRPPKFTTLDIDYEFVSERRAERVRPGEQKILSALTEYFRLCGEPRPRELAEEKLYGRS